MADLPIIFSAPMVRALLEGRKTQTRRVLDPQPESVPNGFMGVRLRYAIADRLYVREAFWLCEECGYRNMCADGVNYSGLPNRGCCSNCDALLPRAKTSPIHMPRWASRLTLTVTDVRVERLQEISAADARAEGVVRNNAVDPMAPLPLWSVPGTDAGGMHARAAYAALWNSLHGPEAWDADPWVAAYTFTVQHGNIGRIGGAQ